LINLSHTLKQLKLIASVGFLLNQRKRVNTRLKKQKIT